MVVQELEHPPPFGQRPPKYVERRGRLVDLGPAGVAALGAVDDYAGDVDHTDSQRLWEMLFGATP